MIYLQLFWSFFKIGLFSFGGGYAMVPLIQKELEANSWMAAHEFADIVSISQMTPGPIAVNAATYIGVRTAGIPGSFFATLGVSLPSFILIIIIAKFFVRFRSSSAVDSVLKGIRPVTVGLIGSAVLLFAGMSIVTSTISLSSFELLLHGRLSEFFGNITLHPGPLLIFAVILVAVKKFKLHPITAVIVSAVLGILLS